MALKFYSHKSGKYCSFSNFYQIQQKFRGCTAFTAEHALQAAKFWETDNAYALTILKHVNPYDAKKLGQSRDHPMDPKWNNPEFKQEVMVEILREKGKANNDFLTRVYFTEDRIIQEDAPKDHIWGIGADGTGQNILGKSLMKYREELFSRLTLVIVKFLCHTETHDGYCSDCELEENDGEIIRKILVENDKLEYKKDGEINIDCLEFLNVRDGGCHQGSGYCGAKNKRTVILAKKATDIKSVDSIPYDSDEWMTKGSNPMLDFYSRTGLDF